MDVEKPDQLDGEMVEFLLGNFDVLPKDIIELIISQIDRRSLWNLCRTNKAFMRLCEDRDLFDKKALQMIDYEAPLSGHFRTLEEQANLIKRNFTSVYNYRCDEGVITEVRFGFQKSINAENVDTFNGQFVIEGLPPRAGTVVWVYIQRPWHAAVRSSVYRSKEEAIADITGGEEPFATNLANSDRYRHAGQVMFLLPASLP
jgi:hypothetical protein